MENILEMIQANELRIGNWVQHLAGWSYRSDKRPTMHFFQWNESDWYALGECTLWLEKVAPIPLTPEILEKAGFVKVNNSLNHDTPMYMNGRSGISLTYYKNCFNFEWKDYNSVQIHFVHQLQNLFRVLTGEELNIEL